MKKWLFAAVLAIGLTFSGVSASTANAQFGGCNTGHHHGGYGGYNVGYGTVATTLVMVLTAMCHTSRLARSTYLACALILPTATVAMAATVATESVTDRACWVAVTTEPVIEV